MSNFGKDLLSMIFDKNLVFSLFAPWDKRRVEETFIWLTEETETTTLEGWGLC